MTADVTDALECAAEMRVHAADGSKPAADTLQRWDALDYMRFTKAAA